MQADGPFRPGRIADERFWRDIRAAAEEANEIIGHDVGLPIFGEARSFSVRRG